MSAKIEIYTTDHCHYCKKAKDFLNKKGFPFIEISVQHDSVKYDEMLSRSNGQRSVPQIFINDRWIGGCDDLLKLEKNKQLDILLS